MPHWKTKMLLPYNDGCVTTNDIHFKRGIFQGDSLSPLLFCVALIPIANILKRAKVGFKVGKKKINHLLYIDDLKVYAKDEEEMVRCKNLVEEFSNDIGMEFGLDKCAVLHLKKGNITNSPIVEEIPLMGCDDQYKYLGIVQCNENITEEVKKKAKREYFNRVRGILKSDISARNITNAICAFAMPIMRYGFGIVRWTQNELRKMDRQTRRLLTKFNFHHPKSNTHRLYLHRSNGGRGLIGVHDCHRQECTAIARYIEENKNEDPLIDLIMERDNFVLKYAEEHIEGDAKEIDEEHDDQLNKMKVHGQYFKMQKETPEVDMIASRRWLEKAHLRFETESLLCAAQEQALATNNAKAHIWKQQGVSPLCRLCKEHPETINHIVSGCKCLAANKYLFRHDQIGKYLHWQILKDIGYKVPLNWTHHQPMQTTLWKGVYILWDMAITTDKRVKCNKPDILVHDTNKRTCTIIDVAVPICANMVSKTAEKLCKYKDLEIEIQKLWNLAEVQTIPIVVGALGTILNGLSKYTKQISKKS